MASTISRRTILVAGLTLPGLTLPLAARSQPTPSAWPERPIRMLVPFAAGGGTDISTRIIAPKLSDLLGQPVIVENRPGAGGTLGTAEIAKAPPDGSAFLMATLSTVGLAVGLYRSLPYDPERDLIAVHPTVLVPIALVVHPALGVRTVPEFVALLKANPGKYSFGSAGNGTSGHIAGAAFLNLTGTEALHVPYRGSGPVFNDLLAGTVHFTFDITGLIKPHHAAGTLRALGIATPERSPELPDVPTFIEQGLPEYRAYSWYGVFAPKATPAPIVARMAGAIETALADTAVSQRLVEQGLVPMRDFTPARFQQFLADELAYWVPIVRATGAKVD
ncbi:MAG: tripartite tricarboxylate transporter substrate binding protein [Acetobacteraceae bacterium]|nr:tripartite tricarboxylate transporter substrate binding protein [Acetobacteraceae bacterium]